MEQVIVNSLILGMNYALIALGLTLIFAIMNVLNFAHGQMYVLGGFITYYALQVLHLPFVVGLVASVVVLVLVGLLSERLLFRRAIRVSTREESTMLLAAGLALLLESLILLFLARNSVECRRSSLVFIRFLVSIFQPGAPLYLRSPWPH